MISCHGKKVKLVPLGQSSQANPVLPVEGRLGQVLDEGGRLREVKLKLRRFLKNASREVPSSKGFTFGLIKVSFSHLTRTKFSSFNKFSFSRGSLASLWLLMTARYLENFLKSSPRQGSCQYWAGARRSTGVQNGHHLWYWDLSCHLAPRERRLPGRESFWWGNREWSACYSVAVQRNLNSQNIRNWQARPDQIR